MLLACVGPHCASFPNFIPWRTTFLAYNMNYLSAWGLGTSGILQHILFRVHFTHAADCGCHSFILIAAEYSFQLLYRNVCFIQPRNAARRNISGLRYADDTTLMAESEEELKSFLMKVKEESEKVGLKLDIQRTKIMASSPITSWQIDGETVADFIFWAPKSLKMVTAALKLKDAYSLEGKL